MKLSIYCLTLFCALLFSSNIIAQTNSAKNAVYFTANSAFVYNAINLNYDRHIRQSEKGFFKNYYLNLGAGRFNVNGGFAPAPSRNGFVSSLGLIGLTGTGNAHFEAGLGVSLNVETKITNIDPGEEVEKDTFVLPDIALGYRYQKENGVVFRVGLGFPHGLYLGFGVSL